MEEGVINQIRTSHISNLFDDHQIITSNSGSGNNWGKGFVDYGREFYEDIFESLRKQAEDCDSLQSFFIISSLGGGTGSGLGSYILEHLGDEFPDVFKFNACIFPSADDDVVTSPYNSMLALSKLIEHSDCVLPIENQALFDIYQKIISQSSTSSASIVENSNDRVFKSSKPKHFDTMNNIVANLLLNLTSSMRFEGSMNVDISDITTNLVPFPNLKFLISSLTPLYTLTDLSAEQYPRTIDQMFIDGFARSSQLTKSDPKNGIYLACALIARGDIAISDIRRNIDKMRTTLKFTNWNLESFKTGICAVPSLHTKRSLLTLANNTCISGSFVRMRNGFVKLYRRKAMVHHYTGFIGEGEFERCLENVTNLTMEYETKT